MTKAGLVLVVTIAVIGLSACAESDGGGRSDAATATPVSPAATLVPMTGDAILVETRVTDARRHTGEVLGELLIGESAFCSGGASSGSSQGPTITTTFSCAEGTLTVQYAPTQRSLVQGAAWMVVSGTGLFDGLHGGGSMVAVFDSEDPDSGREVFTGTITP